MRVVKRILLVVLILSVFGSIFLFLRQFSSPIIGKPYLVKQTASVISGSKIKSNTSPVDYSNDYFSFELPPSFSYQSGSSQRIGNLILTRSYTRLNPTPLIVQIGLYSYNGSLSENTSYNLRKNNPDYIIQNYDGDFISYSNKYDGVVCFLTSSNYLATVSVTTGLQQSGNYLNDEINLSKQIITSWQWR